MARHFYKALFDYDGSAGDNMIPMAAGDVMYSDEEQAGADWYNVTKMSDGSSGLVPANYVKEISAEEAGAVSRPKLPPTAGLGNDENQGISNQTPSLGMKDLSSSMQANQGSVQPSGAPVPSSVSMTNMGVSSTNTGASALGGTQNFGAGSEALPASFAEMFQRHDAYFRQVVKQRRVF